MEEKDKKDLQILRELNILAAGVKRIGSRVEELEIRLQKVIMNLPQAETGKEQPETQLCEIAKKMRDIRREVQIANSVMTYILDNLQL